MSTFRRRLMMQASRLILGIDFSQQPDNEVWYVTTDGRKTDDFDINLIGGYGRQEGLQVVSHTYEDGLGKVRYNMALQKTGENVFGNTGNTLLVSLPRSLSYVGAFSFGNNTAPSVGNLVLLNAGKVKLHENFRPYISKCLYVQPGCAAYYKGLGYNIIERKI